MHQVLENEVHFMTNAIMFVATDHLLGDFDAFLYYHCGFKSLVDQANARFPQTDGVCRRHATASAG